MFAANEPQTKAAVSVAEMARMVGLSRARFYQLVGETFPWPVYDLATRRPFYDAALQSVCLDVRRRNCGVNGKPVLFYARRPLGTPVPGRKSRKIVAVKRQSCRSARRAEGPGAGGRHGDQVAEAVEGVVPEWSPRGANGEVLRAVFLHLRRRNTSDNVR